MDEHREILLTAFMDALMREEPASVLDVGAGSGDILAKLAEASVPAVGTEPFASSRKKAHDRGLVVHEGDAESLAFPDGSFDWVVLRHVLHHSAEPEKALAEARRVTRRGLIIAEPYFDLSVVSQVISEAAERWSREVERRAGRIHRWGMSAGEIIAAMGPLDASWTIEVSSCLPLRPRNLDTFFAKFDEVLEKLETDPALINERQYLAWRGRAGEVSKKGTLIVVARRG